MYYLSTESKPFEMWRYYRSIVNGSPVCKKQAYNAVYPWIEYNGIWFSRELEMGLYSIMNGFAVDSLGGQYELINTIEKVLATKDSKDITYCDYAIKAVDEDAIKRQQMLLLKVQDDIAICGAIAINFAVLKNKIIYTDTFSVASGNDSLTKVLIDTDGVLRKSQTMLCVFSKDVINEIGDSNLINWKNVIVW